MLASGCGAQGAADDDRLQAARLNSRNFRGCVQLEEALRKPSGQSLCL